MAPSPPPSLPEGGAPSGTPSRILVADPIADDGVARLRRAGTVDVAITLGPDELIARIGDYDALVVRSETKVTEAVIAAGRRLRVIGRAGVGVDNIDVAAASQRGILVVNAPTGNTVAAAEHTIAMMLALARNIAPAAEALRQGSWDRARFVGTELRDKTLAVIGLGKIGFEVARMAVGLQMRVVAYDPLVAPERAAQAGVRLVDLDTALAEADVLTVHTPLSDATRGLIGADQLQRMRTGARVVNVGRGGIVDEEALAAAVESGHLAGAAVDVFTREPPPPDHPLLRCAGVLATPHLGASTVEAQVSVATDVADQIVSILRGGPARWAVNAPQLGPEELLAMEPYRVLARRLGSLYAQLGGGQVRGLSVSYRGQVAEAEPAFLTAEIIGGVLQHFTQDPVNVVNARLLARQHGIEVSEQRSSEAVEYASSITLQVDGSGVRELIGTLSNGTPRVVRLDGFHLDLVPQGTFLLFRHTDRPGMIGAIGSRLGRAGVNIAELQLGRAQPRGEAVMVVVVDDPVDAELADELRRIDGVGSLAVVEL
ncbi:MAG TPA: phosphoglycerate dehydrogenase [Candidatus Micrarchaeia archaeon]|nr:phosphoglycerate dehydrogenase [Candidatus Micrarchaeia archaeon]